MSGTNLGPKVAPQDEYSPAIAAGKTQSVKILAKRVGPPTDAEQLAWAANRVVNAVREWSKFQDSNVFRMSVLARFREHESLVDAIERRANRNRLP